MLAQRAQKARMASTFSRVLQNDSAGRPQSILVPGSDAKQYQVLLRRNGSTISGECLMDTGLGHIPCKGNSQSVCYHVFAAIVKAAKLAGKTVRICSTQEGANRLAHIGGQVVRVTSHQQSDKVFWAVVK